jgi:trimeric autotransporter adhesin
VESQAQAKQGNFENVHSSIQINGTYEYVGGIVGVISNGTSIANAYYSGTITSQTGSNGSIGGIVGKTDTGSILRNVNSAVMINTSGMYVGGIVGYANGSLDVENSTSTYEITAHNYVGGLIGYTNSGTYGAIELTNSYGRGNFSTCEG